MRLWKPPKEKQWVSFYADGKRIATMEKTKAAEKEEKRLAGLKGISIVSASAEDLIASRAFTAIPKSITEKMTMAARNSARW